MDIDFDVKEVILKKETNKQSLGKVKLEVYSITNMAIKTGWNSLYFSNNNSIFAFVEINRKKYYLKTIGEVLIKKELQLPEKSKDDVMELIENYYEYDNDKFYMIRDLIDNGEEFIAKKSNMFVIVQSDDIYKALCENEKYIPYIDYPRSLKELEDKLIDFITTSWDMVNIEAV